MHQIIFLVIAAVLAIAATVLAFIFIVPEKRREKMNAFGRFLQDLCSFKFLVVEKILQALYIFSTAFIVLYGVMQLFNIQRDYWSGGVKWMGGMGLLYIVLGPIVVRLSYELLMMVVLLVKNVIAINHKLADQTGRAAGDVFATPDVQELKVAVLQRKTQAPAQEPVQAAWAPVQSPMQEPIQAPVQPPMQEPMQARYNPPFSAKSAAPDWKMASAPAAALLPSSKMPYTKRCRPAFDRTASLLYRSSSASASSCALFSSVMAERMVTVLPRVTFLQPSSSFFISLAAAGAQEPFSMNATWRF